MNSKIYFSDNNDKNFTWWLTRIITHFLLIFPKHLRLKWTKQMLLQPKRHRTDFTPDGIGTEMLTTKEGDHRLYRLGEGPIILLNHGWAGSASQLFNLMEKIAAQGFQAVTFDHLAHGDSKGHEANLFLFIKSTQKVIEHLEQDNTIKGIVCHSMGSTAIFSAIDKPYPLLLIAPQFDFETAIFEKVEQSGMAVKLLTDLMRKLEAQHSMSLQQIDPKPLVANYPADIYIVHDQQDRLVPAATSQWLSENHEHVRLTVTEGLGHGRIIDSDETWENFLVMMGLNQE